MKSLQQRILKWICLHLHKLYMQINTNACKRGLVSLVDEKLLNCCACIWFCMLGQFIKPFKKGMKGIRHI